MHWNCNQPKNKQIFWNGAYSIRIFLDGVYFTPFFSKFYILLNINVGPCVKHDSNSTQSSMNELSSSRLNIMDSFFFLIEYDKRLYYMVMAFVSGMIIKHMLTQLLKNWPHVSTAHIKRFQSCFRTHIYIYIYISVG